MPPSLARGLAGKRLLAYRAGIIAINLILLLQCQTEHLLVSVHIVEGDAADILRLNLLYILAVLLRDKDSGDTRTASPETEEGSVLWMKKSDLPQAELCDNFQRYLEVFMDDSKTEAYGLHGNTVEKSLRVL